MGEWIPTRQEFLQLYKDVPKHVRRTYSVRPPVFDIIPTSSKIGKRTFVEGCLDVVLLLACWSGNIANVSYLLTIYIQYFSIDTLIDKCTSVGDFERSPVFRQTRAMARFEQATCDKVSLLHAAAETIELYVIKLLVSAGANVNTPSKWLISPLMSALMHEWPDRRTESTVAFLINSGANVNCRDADGMTPLMYAVSRVGSSVVLVQMLRKAGANPYPIDNEGYTALHHACLGCRTEIVKYLLKIAPDLLLVRGHPSLACFAPYLKISEVPIFQASRRFMDQSEQRFFDIFLDSSNCPSPIKFDINMLRVVYLVLSRQSYSGIPRRLDALKKIIASDIDPVIEANGGVPVSSPRDVAKEKYQLALLKSIKSMDPTSHVWDRKLIQQCLLVSLCCYMYATVPMMSMLSDHLGLSEQESFFNDYSNWLFVEQLSRMLCFRFNTVQYYCPSQGSLFMVLQISSRFILSASRIRALLNLAVNVFNSLASSLEKVSIRCLREAHKLLHCYSRPIFYEIASLDSEEEAVILMTKFAKCNSPLLANFSEGYPESLLHIALSCRKMLTSPLLQTFLHSGGDRWINTPGVNGRRPLHLCVPKDVADLLVDYGAHLDAVDADESTPEYSNEYFKCNPRPLSCIVARCIVKAGGLTEDEITILPAHVQAFISLHDGHATREEVDGVLLKACIAPSI